MSSCPDCSTTTGWTPGKKRCQPCAERKRGDERDFYTRTAHCGACGQPGTYCVCTAPCGCHELHDVGSGLAADALDRFTESSDGDVPLFDIQPGGTR